MPIGLRIAEAAIDYEVSILGDLRALLKVVRKG